MSYMRYGSELRWFKGTSNEYIYGTIDKDGNPMLYDWRGAFNDPTQWIELIARMLYRETHDLKFVNHVVHKLAIEYCVSRHLRDEVLL